MRHSIIASSALGLAMVAAAPTPTDNVDYSKLDYSHVDYSNVDWDKVDYSKVDFKNLDYSHVDWSKIDWTKVPYSQHVPEPECNDKLQKFAGLLFTSTYHVVAEPGQVVNASNQFTGGLQGASGTYDFGMNAELDLICYYIELHNFRGDYQSPARTATHIHQADRGKNGPPRIAFPNPEPVEGNSALRRSAGCLTGPFVTGINGTDGADTGSGFRVEQLEANPHNFFADVHSSLAVPGAVRGQLA